MTEPTTEPPCSCPAVRAGHDVVGRNWSERCRAHGIGTPWFDANMRVTYESFRRRLFPTLPADWTAEDDLPDPDDDDDDRCGLGWGSHACAYRRGHVGTVHRCWVEDGDDPSELAGSCCEYDEAAPADRRVRNYLGYDDRLWSDWGPSAEAYR